MPKCYELAANGEYAPGLRVNADAVAKGGYRLPTEAEWEYASRAGAGTSRYFGDAPGPLRSYEWFNETSEHNAQRCGILLPNDFGLFDMLSNVAEWCHNRHYETKITDGEVCDDMISDEQVTIDYRYFRGERYHTSQSSVRCAIRSWLPPLGARSDLGFRPARSIP